MGIVSARELDVMQLIAEGQTNEDVARSLKISYHTVKKHVNSICEKLDARNRVNAIAIAVQLGLIRIEVTALTEENEIGKATAYIFNKDETFVENTLNVSSPVKSYWESLTERQREIVLLFAEDPNNRTNRWVALHLGLSIHTIKKHRRDINNKLEVNNPAGLMNIAIQIKNAVDKGEIG